MSRKGNRNNTPYEVKKGHYLVGNCGIYKVLQFLGEGTYGKVAKCIKFGTQEMYAIKIMKNNKAGQKEVESMKLIEHLDPEENHLVQMYECFSFQNMTCIVYELLGNSLFQVMCDQPDPVHLHGIRAFARDGLKALKALKRIGLAHCDIKIDNIMVANTSYINLKLIDFGMATKTKDLSVGTEIQVTPFKSPEVILGLPLDEGVDMWAFGMVLASLYFGEYPFPSETEYETIRAMVQIHGLPEAEMIRKARFKKAFFTRDNDGWRLCTPDEYTQATRIPVEDKNHVTNLDEMIGIHQRLFVEHDEDDHKVFIDLLKCMLEINPKNRITPRQALAHDFITMKHLSGEIKANAVALMGKPQHSNPSPSSCGSLSPKKTVASTHSSLYHSPGEIYSSSPKTPVSSTHSSLYHSPGEIYSSSPKTPVSSTHLSLKRSQKGQKKHMSQENLEKNDLKTNRDKAKKPKGKKKEKACVVKTGQILVGNLGTYEIGEFLGKGSYGEVFKCWKVGSEDFFAIKIIKDVSAGKEEVEAMKLIKDLDPDKHHLSKLYEHFSYRNVICLVYEMLEKSLQNELGTPLHLVGIRAIAGQMFQALDALKSIGVVHGDIKPDNILFVRSEESPGLKLIDFGFATKAEELLRGTEIQVTPFRAPEVILGLPLDESIDMWAFGVVLASLYCGRYPFPRKTEYETIRAMVQIFGLPEDELLAEADFTEDYFTSDDSDDDSNDPGWRLLTPDEYTQGTGEQLQDEDHVVDLKAWTKTHRDLYSKHNKDDHRVFIDLIKRMLEVNPQKRITPSQALAHDFITMKHLAGKRKAGYAAIAKEIMEDAGLKSCTIFKSKRK